MSPAGSRLRAEGLAFFGRMTAGQSHEVTNVLNIINELAGLQLDLLGAAGERPPDLPRLAQLADRIQAQVARGETIIRTVNRFAHSIDLPTALFELGDLLEQIVFLAQRTATLGRVTLTLSRPEESIVLESNPFCVHQAVFCCLETAIAGAGEQRRVSVSFHVGDVDADIEIASADPLPDGGLPRERCDLLKALLEEVGGRVVQLPDGSDRHHFRLRLPRQRSEPDSERRQGGRDAT